MKTRRFVIARNAVDALQDLESGEVAYNTLADAEKSMQVPWLQQGFKIYELEISIRIAE